MGIWYATLESVMGSLDFKETARARKKLERHIEAASRSIEKFLHRKFYPQTDTRYFDWPQLHTGRSLELWLEEDEVISVTTLQSGSTAISASDFYLEPANEGPPYDMIRLDDTSSASYGVSSSSQRDISLTGVFGYTADTEDVATLDVALVDTTGTTVDVSDSSEIGVGSLIKIDSEYMNVTDKTWITTGQTVQTTALTAKSDNVTVLVTTGTEINQDEVILIDSEKMLVLEVSGNTLTVERAYDGSVLAAHNTGTTIYAKRRLTVERGAVGSTAATHLINATVSLHLVPSMIQNLCIAEVVTSSLQEQSGYARIIGLRNYNLRAANQREAIGRGIESLREDAYAAYGRKYRKYAI